MPGVNRMLKERLTSHNERNQQNNDQTELINDKYIDPGRRECVCDIMVINYLGEI